MIRGRDIKTDLNYCKKCLIHVFFYINMHNDV